MFIVVLVGAYFLGAIPFGLIISKKFFNTDIRQHGSGNPGATNVWRVLGWKPGAATLALDLAKGALPVLITKWLLPYELGTQIGVGGAAIIGHSWSVFLKGSGGKSVATSAGVFLALMPLHALIALGVFAVVAGTTRMISAGSVSAAAALAASTFILKTPSVFQFMAIMASILVIYKHIPNIKRMIRKEENKVSF